MLVPTFFIGKLNYCFSNINNVLKNVRNLFNRLNIRLILDMDKVKLVVESIIGGGKTTVTDYLAKEFNLKYFKEDPDIPLLKKFYASQKAYALPLQYNLLARRSILEKNSDDELRNNYSIYNGVILDRALIFDKAFARVLTQNESIGRDDLKIFENEIDVALMNFKKYDKVIYLDVTPQKADERQKKRAREMELKASTDFTKGTNSILPYLVQLSKEYKGLLEEIRKDYDVMVFDLNDEGMIPKLKTSLEKIL